VAQAAEETVVLTVFHRLLARTDLAAAAVAAAFRRVCSDKEHEAETV
jgi:hypothetical protein